MTDKSNLIMPSLLCVVLFDLNVIVIFSAVKNGMLLISVSTLFDRSNEAVSFLA